MPPGLLPALCLVLVLEGLFLFVAPRVWQRTAEQLVAQPPAALRRIGAAMLVVGLAALWWARAA